MKALFVTPYLSIDSYPEFCVNKTGFGYMVSDIADSVGKNIDLDVYATDSRGKNRKHSHYNILGRSILNIITNIHHCVPIKPTIKLIKKYKVGFGMSIRLLYYWASTGYLKELIKRNEYDIIHIHDLSVSTPIWLLLCKSCEKPNFVTLHALKSFSNTIRISKYGKLFERDFIKTSLTQGQHISVLSSGMKNLIENTARFENLENIHIIPNAIFLKHNEDVKSYNIRERYEIPNNAKIILCVGNISRRKNQHQLIRAFELLPDEIANNTYIMFLGGIHDKEYSESYLTADCKRKNKYIFCGVIKKSEVNNFYMQANAVALVSKSEAFGLSLVEGMSYGLPCLMHKEMEAFHEIYKDGCAVAVSEYTDQCIAQGLQCLLLEDWNKDLIIEHSKQFTPDIMARRYLNLYDKLINDFTK